MTLEQLRIFVAVAEREHVTAAAAALNVSQSAASAAISALEDRHDVKLFDRIGRRIVLTEIGRIFLEEARAVLARASVAESVLDEFAGLKRGTLRVVASQTIAAYWLPPILADFKERRPLLGLEVAIANTQQAAARVREGLADFGIVEGRVDDPVLATWPLGEDKLLLVQALPVDVIIDAAWLRAARWVRREPGSGTRSTFDEVLRHIGIEPDELDAALVLPSNESVRTAVEGGAGVAALSSLVVDSAIAEGKLHALPFDLGARPFFGLWHKERTRTRATDALLTLIREKATPHS